VTLESNRVKFPKSKHARKNLFISDGFDRLAVLFHPTKNMPATTNTVVAGSHKKFWWKCDVCEHDWQAKCSSVKRGTGCPACAGKVPTSENNLSVTHPELAKEFHPILNEPLTTKTVLAGTHKKLWWKCPVCEHEWKTRGSNRVNRGSGCPPCGRRRANKTRYGK
jgi:hypothetical protein